MIVRLDLIATIREMSEAFAETPQHVADDCNAIALEIYDEYFAENRTVGEFLCVMVYLLYKASAEIRRVKDKQSKRSVQ